MADTVTSITVLETDDEIEVHLTGISDGTGESNVAKLDKSALLAVDAAEPASLDILSARWNIQGYQYIKLHWDHTTDDTALVLTGSGFEDYEHLGEIPAIGQALDDPRSAGGTGDLLLTSAGAASGASYDITLRCRKRPD